MMRLLTMRQIRRHSHAALHGLRIHSGAECRDPAPSERVFSRCRSRKYVDTSWGFGFTRTLMGDQYLNRGRDPNRKRCKALLD